MLTSVAESLSLQFVNCPNVKKQEYASAVRTASGQGVKPPIAHVKCIYIRALFRLHYSNRHNVALDPGGCYFPVTDLLTVNRSSHSRGRSS